MSHEPFEALAAVYAVGALDGEDLARFEAHLASCPACHASVREGQETLARVALSVSPQNPPLAAREAVMRRLAERRDVRSRGWLRWAAATLVAAGAAAMFAGTWVAVRYEARLGQMARETAAVRERVERNEAALREQVALYRGAIDLLRDPATQVIDLRGQGIASMASGRIIWNEAIGGHLLVAGLPPAPAGQRYALWTIAGAAPKPAGLFGVDADGRAVHQVHADSGVKVFAVSLEPEGGTPAPTGPIVLASK